MQDKNANDCMHGRIEELFNENHAGIVNEVVERVKNDDTAKDDDSSDVSIPRVRITRWQQTVLRMVVQGKTDRQIAIETKRAEGTIRNILWDLRKKLELVDKGQLGIYAVVHGLVTEEELSRFKQKKPRVL